MTLDQKIEAAAEAAHEANRIYCDAIGDHTQHRWQDAPDWQKQSAREGVAACLNGATPREQHDLWVQHKEKEGWHYGSVKDPHLKTHPCMVPYDLLPPEQRAKDELYQTVVRGIVKALTP